VEHQHSGKNQRERIYQESMGTDNP
jgi:hypothetical protein